ncbi:hypothetical protein HNR42_001764 [Deinobacterium chartae]|uniref:Phosphatidic acid phosphatase type 2/haloperoxidase domain-containing protein n=1 Tax=Deinobacterium chartae TaxID=521158 RepID=A0A841I1R8_9DEIO|nr:phosphatase PAP2 family protein [Deinobacterium chartae]MBB6098339.1 hypothetical protein [Deinobacterium chartae]
MDTIAGIQQVLGPNWQSFFLFITQLGSDYAYIAVLTLYYWLVDPRMGRALGVFFGLSVTVNEALKPLLDLKRPYEVNPGIASEAARLTAGPLNEHHPGFPSGHAQVTATLWLTMAWQQRRRWLWIVATVLVLLVSFSRLYLGVHYPIDVLAGLGIGVLLAWLAWRSGLLTVTAALAWGAVVVALVVGSLLPEWARGLAIGSAFLVSRPTFDPPRSWPARIGVAAVGLIAVVAVFLGSSLLLPEEIKRSGWGSFLRYFVLVLLATEGVPRLMRLPASRRAGYASAG